MKHSQNRRITIPTMTRNFRDYWSDPVCGRMGFLSLPRALPVTATESDMETDVENYLVELVEQHDGVCFKWVSPGRVGVPDRIVLLPNEMPIFVETKAPGGVLKPWQARCHELLRD